MPHKLNNDPSRMFHCRMRAGMTLTDLLVSMFILAITAVAFLSILLTSLYFIDMSKEQTIAVSDLRNMMESIRATPFSNMNVKFPGGTQDGPASNRYDPLVGGYALMSEHITVTYANNSSDLMEVRVELTWRNKYGRSMSSAMSTYKAR
jgi:hypothetical protein